MDPNPPPPFVLIALASVGGVVAQLGASFAFDMAKDTRKLIGSLLLSVIFSAAGTELLAYFSPWPDDVCVAIGALLGTVPASWTVRAGVLKIGQRLDVNASEIMTAPQPPITTQNPTGGPHP